MYIGAVCKYVSDGVCRHCAAARETVGEAER